MSHEIIRPRTWAACHSSQHLASTNFGWKSMLGTWSPLLSARPIDHQILPYHVLIRISLRVLFMPRRLTSLFIYWEICRLENTDNPEAKALINFCLSYNLSQLITIPTRVTENSKSILDVILVSHTKQVQRATVMKSRISDNDLVCVTLKLKKARCKPVYFTARSLKQIRRVLQWCIAGNVVDDVFDDVEDKVHTFNLLFMDILKPHAPVKTFNIHGRPNPCVTNNIRGLMKTRDHWRREAKKTNDWMAWTAYRNCRQEIKREIRIAEREFVAEQIQGIPNNPNNIWKAIRHCIPNKSSTRQTYSKDGKSVADEFNRYFVSIGQRTVDKITSLANEYNLGHNKSYFSPRHYLLAEQFTLRAIFSKQIECITTSMPSNKYPGIDKIPIRVIKDCLTPILPAITSIVNASFVTFPSDWKTA